MFICPSRRRCHVSAVGMPTKNSNTLENVMSTYTFFLNCVTQAGSHTIAKKGHTGRTSVPTKLAATQGWPLFCGTLGGPVCRFVHGATAGSHLLLLGRLSLDNNVTHTMKPHFVLGPHRQKLMNLRQILFVRGDSRKCVGETQACQGQKSCRSHS